MSSPSHDRPDRSASQTAASGGGVRRPVLQFLGAGLVALAVIGAIAFVALRNESTDEAIRDSRNVTRLIAQSVVEPTIEEYPGVLAGDPSALAAFDQSMKERVVGDNGVIVRVKVWRQDGTIVYSDFPGQTGRRYELSEDEIEAFASDEATAEVSHLDGPENVSEQGLGKLLEVYFPIRGPDGEPLLVETYQRFSAVSSGGDTILNKFLPIFLISLVVLSLAQAPLAWSMARRLRESQRERERLLLSAIEASDRERRRIASDVHDGPVQELAGLSFALAGAADRVGPDTPPEVRRSLDDAAATTRGVMRQLRGMLVEIHPPNLHASGLESALSDLLAPLPAKGIATSLSVAPVTGLTPEVEALLFRGAQEALRNVQRHSGASRVDVAVGRENGAVTLRVDDDGRGFAPADREAARADGHLGLELLHDLVDHAGGRVDIASAPGGGTSVAIAVPLP